MDKIRVFFWRSLQGRILAVIVISLLSVTCLLVVGISLLSQRMTQSWTELYFTLLAEKAETQVLDELAQIQSLAQLGSVSVNAQGVIDKAGETHPALPMMQQFFEVNPAIYSSYIGRGDGSFFQVIRVPEGAPLKLGYTLPVGTARVVRVIPADPQRTHLWAITFLDRNGAVLERIEVDDPVFDPRERAWFKDAAQSSETVLTEPYRFLSTPSLGVSAARMFADRNSVFGVDLTLDTLRREMSEARISDNGSLLLLDRSDRVLAASGAGAPGRELSPLSSLETPLYRAVAQVKQWGSYDKPLTVYVDGTQYLVWLSSPRVFGAIAIAAPASDFYGPTRMTLMVLTGVACLLVLVVLLVARSILHPAMQVLQGLTDDAERVSEMDFTGELPIQTPVRELDALTDAMKLMKRTLLVRTSSLGESQLRLRRLIDVGSAMASEHDLGKLIEAILLEAKFLTNAEGGTLYVRTDTGDLGVEFVYNDQLEISFGGKERAHLAIPTLKALNEDGSPNLSHPITAAMHRRQSIDISDIYQASDYDLSPFQEADEWIGHKTKSMLVVPLITSDGRVMGVVQLVNARAAGMSEPGPFPNSARALVQSLAGQAAAALHNRMLVDGQNLLMDSIVQLLAGAIDAKSPYTGDHASRVPDIASRIANALCAERPDVRDRWFNTEDQWRTFRMASWLHDCGKVTSPEYVMDKATKLETVNNRIHEIRTRFEVLLRDAEIQQLKGEISEQQFQERRTQLQDDFAFVAQCNVGAEFMGEDKVERIRSIAEQTWLRHFDNRLGLAHEELQRVSAEPAVPLPALEHLLADRPDQVIAWDPRDVSHNLDGSFKVKVPQVMYNRGEIYNLCVSRGTLTSEERFKITDHAIQTIRILENLPLPPELREVPLFAGAHHETLNGKGYPRGLTADQLPPPARILAIADIFDALVAPDRPYKKAKKLSEALAILAGFRDRGEIDAEIFGIFLRSGAMQRYAEEHLLPFQLDEVDIERFASPPQ